MLFGYAKNANVYNENGLKRSNFFFVTCFLNLIK